MIVWFTVGMTLGGTVLLFLFEPSLQSLPENQRLLPAFFQTMTAMTTVGFNTVPIGQLAKASILLITVLMVIGASPAGKVLIILLMFCDRLNPLTFGLALMGPALPASTESEPDLIV